MRNFKTFKIIFFTIFLALLSGCQGEGGQSRQEEIKEQLPDLNPEKSQQVDVPSSSSCYKELCSDRQELDFFTATEQYKKPSEIQSQYYKDNVEVLTQKFVQKEFQVANQLKQKIIQNDAAIRTANLNEKQLNIIKMFLLITSEQDTQMLQNFVDLFVKSSLRFQATNIEMKYGGPKAYFETLYPDLSLQDAVQKEFAYIQAMSLKIKKDFKIPLVRMTKALKNRLSSEDSLSDEDLKAIANTAYLADMFNFVLFEKPESVSFIGINKSQLLEFYNAFLNSEDFDFSVSHQTETETQCREGYFKAINSHPSRTEVLKFSEISQAVREEMLNHIGLDDQAAAKIQKVKFKNPMTAEEISSLWQRSLKEEAEELSTEVQAQAGLDAADLLTLSVLSVLNDRKNVNKCNFVNYSVSDSTNGEVINISFVSAKNPSVGVGILAHEFSHLVANHSTEFVQEKRCLTEKQGTSQFLAEDFSDFLSAQVSEKIFQKFRIPEKNFGCFIASLDESKHLVNKSTSGVHSSGLFRALHVAQVQGRSLPKACLDQMQRELPSANRMCR